MFGRVRKAFARKKEEKRRVPTRYELGCCATETWPPPEWRGRWFREVMRLERFLNMTSADEDVADKFIEFHGCGPEHDYRGERHCDASVTTITKDGYVFASAFESPETCGLDRSLEQNCEGLYMNITEWIFQMKESGHRPDFPGSEEELEIWLSARGI